MLRKRQHRLCFFMVCVLLMAGMHTTYVKADYIAERAVALEAARIYADEETDVRIEQIQKTDEILSQNTACVVESVNPLLRTVLGRVTSRGISVRKDFNFFGILLCALCIAYFILRCCQVEEILYLHEKKYRVALIKYIHDMDGKKRFECLT